MTTWATMYQEILSDAGRVSGDAAKVKLAIVAAIDRHRGQSFFFNQREFRFDTIQGRARYGEDVSGYPRGLVSVIGDLTLLVEQDTANPQLLARVATEQLQRARALQASTQSQPEAWGFFDRSIELFPTPDETIHTVTGQGVLNAWGVTKRYDTPTSAFKFYKPDGGEVGDNYPSGAEVDPWFGEAYELIKAYASYVLYGEKLHSQDGRKEALQMRYLECLDELQTRSNRLEAPQYIEPMELW
jgi:hypothetical protein